jgi:hypothetical protein
LCCYCVPSYSNDGSSSSQLRSLSSCISTRRQSIVRRTEMYVICSCFSHYEKSPPHLIFCQRLHSFAVFLICERVQEMKKNCVFAARFLSPLLFSPSLPLLEHRNVFSYVLAITRKRSQDVCTGFAGESKSFIIPKKLRTEHRLLLPLSARSLFMCVFLPLSR